MSSNGTSSRINDFLVGAVVRHPLASIIFSLLFVVAMLPGAAKLEADFTHRAFFWDDDPLLQQFDAFERRFGNDDAVVVAVHSESGIFDVESATLLRELTEEMWRVPEVIRVDSLSNHNWVHARGDDIIVEPLLGDGELTPELLAERKAIAMTDEVVPGYLVSNDAKTALVFARIKPGIDAPPNDPVITANVRELTERLARGDHSFYLTGVPVVNTAFKESSELDMSRLVPVVLAAAAVCLFLMFRSVSGVVLPFVVVVLSVLGTFGFSGLIGVPITNVTAALPNILIAVSIADSVHLLVTYYRSRAAGLERRDAARHSLSKNLLPTFVTSITTAAGFFSFVGADIKPIAGLGWIAGFGTLLAWALTFFLVGGLMVVLPLRQLRLAQTDVRWSERLSERLTGWIARNRTATLGATFALTLVAGGLMLLNEVNSDPLKYFRADVPVRIANELVEREVGGARGVELVVDAGAEDGIKDPELLRKVDALQTWIAAQPGVTRVVSILDVLKGMNRALNGGAQEAYTLAGDRETIGQELFLYSMSLPQGMDLNDRVTLKNDALRLTVLWTIPTSREAVAAIEAIEAKGREMGLSVHATGKNRLYQGMNSYVVESFIVSLFTALLLISASLMVAFRSVKVGLLAMLPNLVPLVAGGALLWLIRRPLDIGTVIVASVCLGIAVDNTIHIIASYRRLRAAGVVSQQAIRDVLAHTGPALASTTAVLVAGFGAFAFATFMPNVYFGIMTASVLTIALVASLVFLPALLLEKEQPVRATAAARATASPAAPESA